MSKFRELLQKYRVVVGILAVALVLIVAISTVLFILIQRDQNISTSDAVITNLTDTAFTVTWVSDDPYVGSIVYKQGEGWTPIFAQLGHQVAWDDRDVELNDEGEYVLVGNAEARYTHHVTIRNLKPDTVYSFRVAGSINGKEMTASTVRTREVIVELNTPDPAYGQIENVDANDSFIILGDRNDLSEAAPLISSPISSNATYSVDVNFFDTENKSAIEFYAMLRNSNQLLTQHEFTSQGYKPLETIIITNDTVETPFVESGMFIPNYGKIYKSVNAQEQCPTNSCINFAQPTNIRAGAGTNYKVLSTEGDINSPVEKQILACENEGDIVWYNVNTADDQPGFVLSSFFSPTACSENIIESEASEIDTPAFSCEGLGEQINYKAVKWSFIRKQATTASSTVGFLIYGAQVLGCAEPVNGDDPYNSGNSDWIIINKNGREAFVYSQLLSRFNPTERTEPYYVTNNTASQIPNSQSIATVSLSTPESGEPVPDNVSKGGEINIESFPPLSNNNGTLWDIDLKSIANPANPGTFLLVTSSGDKLTSDRCPGSLMTISKNFGVGAANFDPVLCRNGQMIGVVGDLSVKTSGANGEVNAGDVDGGPYKGLNLFSESWIDGVGGIRFLEAKFDHVSEIANIDYRIVRAVAISGQLLIAKIEAYDANDKLINSYSYGNPPGSNFVLYNKAATGIPGAELIPINSSVAKNPFSNSLISGIQAEGENIIESGRTYEVIFSANNSYRKVITAAQDDEPVLVYFEDLNNNGVFDSDEEILDGYEPIAVRQIATNNTYEINPGWNLVNIPPSIDDYNTAAELNQFLLSTQSISFRHMAAYSSGKFNMYSFRDGQNFGDNFALEIGRSMFVFWDQDFSVTVELPSQNLESAPPLLLENGWNLVGFTGYSNLTTESVFDSALTQNVGLSTISQFENSRYDSVVSDSGTIFGNNFNIVDTRGYFIRVDSFDSPIFTPE